MLTRPFAKMAVQPIVPPTTTKMRAMKEPKIRKNNGGDMKSPNGAAHKEMSTVKPIPKKANPNTPGINRWMVGIDVFVICISYRIVN